MSSEIFAVKMEIISQKNLIQKSWQKFRYPKTRRQVSAPVRERTALRVRRMRTHFGDRAFPVAGLRCLNNLPPVIRLFDSVDSFNLLATKGGGGGTHSLRFLISRFLHLELNFW